MTRRVVITGLGVVCPVGNNTKDAWQSIYQGISGIDIVKDWQEQIWADKKLEVIIGGEVKNFNADDFIEPKKDTKKMGRFMHLALAASKEAWAMANLPVKLEEPQAYRAGAIIGVGMLGLDILCNNYDTLTKQGPHRVSPFFVPGTISNLAAGHLGIKYNLQADNFVISSACTSGTHAIGEAFHKIRYNKADLMIAGGTESSMHALALAGFNNMHALNKNANNDPTKASKPFDLHREGFVMGEGAGVLILEDLESALKRNANIIAEIVGYGSSCDANHITAPAPFGAGAQRAMRLALEDANISPDAIDYINAHGTSTPLNDKLESYAIKVVFKEHAKNLMVSSTKSMTGHLLGAAGGIEAVFSTLALKNGIIPPTINLETPDPECDLDYVANIARKKEITYALSNSFGFGGTNGVIALKKFS